MQHFQDSGLLYHILEAHALYLYVILPIAKIGVQDGFIYYIKHGSHTRVAQLAQKMVTSCMLTGYSSLICTFLSYGRIWYLGLKKILLPLIL